MSAYSIFGFILAVERKSIESWTLILISANKPILWPFGRQDTMVPRTHPVEKIQNRVWFRCKPDK
jgi:hypothetical protein